MSTAYAIDTKSNNDEAPELCVHHAELLSLVDARATHQGRTDAGFPGLVFYRFPRAQSCAKGVVPGATLVVVVRGRKTVRVAGQTLHADPMRCLVISRETALETTTTEPAEDAYLAVSLTFPPETIVKVLVALADAGAEPPDETVPAFVSCVDPRVAAALIRLLHAVDDPVERKLLAPSIVEECALQLLRCDAAAAMRGAIRGDVDIVKVESAMQFMRAHAARQLTVQQIARHVGMSPSHFAHRFRDVARVSPMRFLRHVRLSEARSLMLTEGTRPSEAASRVGFESASHFTREFKRCFGASPAEYVRRFREPPARVALGGR